MFNVLASLFAVLFPFVGQVWSVSTLKTHQVAMKVHSLNQIVQIILWTATKRVWISIDNYKINKLHYTIHSTDNYIVRQYQNCASAKIINYNTHALFKKRANYSVTKPCFTKPWTRNHNSIFRAKTICILNKESIYFRKEILLFKISSEVIDGSASTC